jgi:hypothetical protein
MVACFPASNGKEVLVGEDKYWLGNDYLLDVALRAIQSGQSIDQLFWSERSTWRICSANLNGKPDLSPTSMKSNVTPYRSATAAANVGVIDRWPFSKRVQYVRNMPMLSDISAGVSPSAKRNSRRRAPIFSGRISSSLPGDSSFS